jgi:hypothetical protein
MVKRAVINKKLRKLDEYLAVLRQLRQYMPTSTGALSTTSYATTWRRLTACARSLRAFCSFLLTPLAQLGAYVPTTPTLFLDNS